MDYALFLFLCWQGLPALGSLLIPHSLSLDQSSHTLYVADRENGRVQSISSISGTFVDEIILPEFGGKVFAVDYSVSKRTCFCFFVQESQFLLMVSFVKFTKIIFCFRGWSPTRCQWTKSDKRSPKCSGSGIHNQSR